MTLNPVTLTSDLKGSLLWPSLTHTKFSWDHARGIWDIEDFSLWPWPQWPWPLTPWGPFLAQAWYIHQVWVRSGQGSSRYWRFFSMTLTPVTLTFDPVGSLLSPSLTHTLSLDEIGQRISEIQKCDLWPEWPWPLKNNPLPPLTLLWSTPTRVPSLVTIALRT